MLLRLERLDFSCNSLNDQSFPPSFERLTNLVELNLNNNLLTVVPKAILSLRKIQRMYIGAAILIFLNNLGCTNTEG